MHIPCNATYIGPSLATSCYGGNYIIFMAIINTLIQKNDKITEMCERITPKLQPDEEYDFVVLGGGSAGSVVGARLSENPQWKVLIVEAGQDEPPGTQVPSLLQNLGGNPAINWLYKTEPQKKACLGKEEQRCLWPRGKVLGGCGAINGMMYLRGVPRDYDNWAKMGNPGWEFSNLLDVFLKSEDNQQIGGLVEGGIHGTGGPITVARFPYHPPLADDILEAAKEINYTVPNDLNQAPYSGFTIAQMNVRNGARVSSARAYLRPARNRSNLHIMLNSTVTKIMLKTVNKKKVASAIQFIYNNHSYTVKIKKEAIVSGGTINSPQMLLLSGIGPKETLEKVNIKQEHDLPGVGKNLHNHVSFSMPFKLNSLKDVNDLNWDVLKQYIDFQNGPMSSTGLSQMTARLTTKFANHSDQPDFQIFFSGFLAKCSRTGDLNEVADLNNPNASKTFSIAVVNLHPKSRGAVTLNSSNPLAPPLLNPNYLDHDDDVKVLIEGVRVVQKLSTTAVLQRKYGIELVRANYGDCEKQHIYDSDDFWECAIRYDTVPENHQAGSCKMGPISDSLAVVDSKLQVHGIEGLRVMDASVMPIVVSGNTHATVVMIAEKGVQYLREKWAPK